MNYPDNWFCKNCSKQFYEHVKIRTPDEESSAPNILEPATKHWCHTWAEVSDEYSISALDFLPVDNLTQIELLANNKGIVDNETKGKQYKITH